ncbi:MAG: substrate-binding periplasmic protein [Hyphomicrobiales bacterium]
MSKRFEISRRIFLTGLTSAVTVASAGVALSADLLEDIKKRGYIRVGAFSIPPESWIDIGSGEWMGIDADFTKAIARSMGVEVDPVIITHSALAPALQSGRVDTIVGLYRTEERKMVMAYNEIPFWYGVDVLIARKDDSSIKSFVDMKGKSLGTVRGSAQELEATKLQDKFGVGDIRKYESADPMLLDLKAGRIDAAIWWGFTFDYAVIQNPSYELKVVEYMPPEYLGSDMLPGTFFVFAKQGTDTLIKAFDAEIKKLLDGGEGKKIMAKYGLTSPSYLTGRM